MPRATQAVDTVDQETGEVTTSQELAVSERAGTQLLVDGNAYKIVKLVNVPTLKHESNETVFVRIDAPIRTEPNKNSDTNGDISVARVTELTGGQPFEYVCNAMTVDNLRHAYPDDSYVGKCFAIQKRGVVAGKRYKETHVVEIEPA